MSFCAIIDRVQREHSARYLAPGSTNGTALRGEHFPLTDGWVIRRSLLLRLQPSEQACCKQSHELEEVCSYSHATV